MSTLVLRLGIIKEATNWYGNTILLVGYEGAITKIIHIILIRHKYNGFKTQHTDANSEIGVVILFLICFSVV